jgi:uncharacterized membrane protein
MGSEIRSEASQAPSGEAPPTHRGWLNPDSLTTGEGSTALVHLYRGEVSRSNTWRSRLDATTNWAVVTTGIALSYAFGAPTNTPVVILIVSLLVLLFLFIEARRYRYYELWTHRVRLLEMNFYSGLLSPTFKPEVGWAQELANTLLYPAFPIGLLEALGRRYRRNYALLFVILTLSWMAKLAIHPTSVSGWSEFMERAAVGPVAGWVVLLGGILFNCALIALGLFTVGLRRTDAEVFDQTPVYGRIWARMRAATREALEIDLASFKPTLAGGRKLVFIISDEVEAVSRGLMNELDRGVTLIRGQGMYSGKEHGILMSVVRSRQVEALREIVHEADPNAFVVISAAQDVRGEGFRPLET